MTAGSGATPSRAAPGGAGGLGDILGSILGGSETVGGDAGGVEPYRGISGSQRTPAEIRGHLPAHSNSRPKCRRGQE